MSTSEWSDEEIQVIRIIEEQLTKLSPRARERLLERLRADYDVERPPSEWRLAIAAGKPKGEQ